MKANESDAYVNKPGRLLRRLSFILIKERKTAIPNSNDAHKQNECEHPAGMRGTGMDGATAD